MRGEEEENHGFLCPKTLGVKVEKADDINTVTLKSTAGHMRPCICVPVTPLFLLETDPMATVGIRDVFPRGSEGAV